MKKLFTILVLVLSVLFASTSFAQIKCIYIVKENATRDQKIINYLNENGYVVTVEVADGLVPAGDYDLAVISETNGSRDAVWTAFTNAPMPFVGLSAFAAGRNLGWTTGQFSNTSDVAVTSVETSHPILDGITSPIFHSAPATTEWGDHALQWATYPTLPDGATIITTVTKGSFDGPDGPLPHIIAFEKNTELNTEILQNRAVNAGFNHNANVNLTDSGLKAIKQACDWVVGDASTAIPGVVADNLLMKRGDELVNPTNLKVDIYNISGASVLNSNESSINLSGLPRGVYIANTNAGALKFIK